MRLQRTRVAKVPQAAEQTRAGRLAPGPVRPTSLQRLC